MGGPPPDQTAPPGNTTPRPSGQAFTPDEKTWAMLSHLSVCFGFGIIGPLIILLVKKDESRFVAFHARQALIGHIAGILLCCIGIFPVMIFGIIAAIKISQGEDYEYPLIGGWARKWQESADA